MTWSGLKSVFQSASRILCSHLIMWAFKSPTLNVKEEHLHLDFTVMLKKDGQPTIQVLLKVAFFVLCLLVSRSIPLQ